MWSEVDAPTGLNLPVKKFPSLLINLPATFFGHPSNEVIGKPEISKSPLASLNFTENFLPVALFVLSSYLTFELNFF